MTVGYCYPCAERIDDGELLDHVRLIHPDDQPERWPDGDLVIHDEDWRP